MGASHVGLGPGFVNKDEPLGIEIQLTIKPASPSGQDVRSLLFPGVKRLFLRVIPCRAKNRRIVPNPNAWPRRARAKRSSSMVMSGVSPSKDRISVACASIRPERRSPPRRLGCAPPVSRRRARHRLTLAALTPKRSPASRWLRPSSTAARTRSRKSTERAFDMIVGLHPTTMFNLICRPCGIPADSIRSAHALVLSACLLRVR